MISHKIDIDGYTYGQMMEQALRSEPQSLKEESVQVGG